MQVTLLTESCQLRLQANGLQSGQTALDGFVGHVLTQLTDAVGVQPKQRKVFDLGCKTLLAPLLAMRPHVAAAQIDRLLGLVFCHREHISCYPSAMVGAMSSAMVGADEADKIRSYPKQFFAALGDLVQSPETVTAAVSFVPVFFRLFVRSSSPQVCCGLLTGPSASLTSNGNVNNACRLSGIKRTACNLGCAGP